MTEPFWLTFYLHLPFTWCLDEHYNIFTLLSENISGARWSVCIYIRYCAIHKITFQLCPQGHMRTHKYSASINKSFTVVFLQPELVIPVICLCPTESGKQSSSNLENKLADSIHHTILNLFFISSSIRSP